MRQLKAYGFLWALLLATAWGGSVLPSNAAVLCTAKSSEGTVRVRTACKPNEAQLDLATLGIKAPPGIIVKDATGAVFGFIVEGESRVLYQTDDALIAIGFEADGSPVHASAVRLYHETSNCSDLGRLDASPVYGGLLSHVKKGVVIGTTLHYPSTSGTDASINSFSDTPVQASSCVGEGQSFIAPDTCCFTRSQPSNGLYAPPATADLSNFVSPFHVEVVP